MEYNLVPELIKRGEAIYGYKEKSNLYDIGTPERLSDFIKSVKRRNYHVR